ncbi:TonB family protein [Mesorhizobium sp.]|uniref:TonB family protein n=1 Tax=Mesorhizobium sp. TaxID=1871066 RepID=UPI0025C57F35|nr:TonB family protein [Mesorhizobium sp.]
MGIEPALARGAVALPLAGIDFAPLRAIDLDLTTPDRSRQLPRRAMQDTISDTSSELTAAPGEPLAQTRAPESSLKWLAAMGASGSLHAALAAAFLIAPATTLDFQDAMNAEGADQVGASVVGSATDGQLPGSVNVSLVPPQPAKRQPPGLPIDASQPQETTARVPQPVTEPVKQPDAAPEILVAGTPRDDLHNAAPKDGPPAPPITQPQSAEPEPTFTGQPPIPTARPSASEGSGATNSTADARGSADGAEIKASIASKGKAKTANGDAARSRYSGEVASKLAKANRLVSKSAQAKALNNATVSFVVLVNGSVTDLQLAKSSGSPELDQFALNLVRQQAPFPPIPPEIGISSWRFRAPIGPY